MDAKEMRARLLHDTRDRCKLFDNRLHLDISRLGECPRKLAWEMLYSVAPNDDLTMRLHIAQLMESNLVHRIATILDGSFGMPKPLYAMAGKLLGYTSGEVGNTLIKIKSVPSDEAMPDRRAPNNHYWQTQALMHFGPYEDCIIIYESRASGRIRTYGFYYSNEIGQSCEAKAILVLSAVRNRTLPDCSCGKCKENGYTGKIS